MAMEKCDSTEAQVFICQRNNCNVFNLGNYWQVISPFAWNLFPIPPDPLVNSFRAKDICYRISGLNETRFSYYTKGQGKGARSAMEIQFNICQRLMPGMKPYYQLAVDGKLIGKSKKVLSGCFRVKERVKFSFDTGMISLFIFVSPDGTIGELKPVSFFVDGGYNKKKKATMPVASPIPLDSGMEQYV